MKKRFAISGVMALGILLTGCSSPSQSASQPLHHMVQIDNRAHHKKTEARNFQCQSIQATMPAGIYNKGIYHNTSTGAVLITLPLEITKLLTHYDKSASYSRYAVIAYRLNVSLPCPNGLMVPIEPHTKIAIIGFLNPGEVKISVVKEARAVSVTTSIPGSGNYTYTKFVGNSIYSRILKVASNTTYRLTIK
ncbi:MAG: hypothetical protein ACYCYO_16505 [Bacilli bacterium]